MRKKLFIMAVFLIGLIIGLFFIPQLFGTPDSSIFSFFD